MLCKRTIKNQITIPKKIIKNFSNVEYFDIKQDKDKIILFPVNININTSKIQNKIRSLGIVEKDIEDAIDWARNK